MGDLWAVLQLSQQSIGNTGENKKSTSRLRVLLRKTHNPEVAGSSPAAATKRVLKIVILSTLLNFLTQMIFAF